MSDENNTEKKTVLVVEDEVDLREALAAAIGDAGFNVIEAGEGVTALKFAFTEKPDLILLDLMMPHMGGHEVLARLRDDEWGRYAKVIVLTALDDMESLSQTLEYGAHEYLVKNQWKLADIVKRIEERLSK
jgi:two-component system phosphate regulon response regulator PhoB